MKVYRLQWPVLVPLLFLFAKAESQGVVPGPAAGNSLPREPVEDRVKLAAKEWSPYQYSTKDGQIHGLAIKPIRCAFAQMKQPYQVAFMDWSKAQLYARQGEFDGFFLASDSKFRNQFAKMSDPIVKQNWVLYSLQDISEEQFYTMDYKENVSVAATFASAKWYWLKENDYRVEKFPKNNSYLVDLLLKRKVSAVVENQLIMETELNRRGYDPGGLNQVKLDSNYLGVYFNKTFLASHPGFLDRFNQALKPCLAQGAGKSS